MSQNGIIVQNPSDIIKDTYTLEFLGLPEKSVYSEKDLEDKIIDNLQSFLLELGKGFTFVKRQYPLTRICDLRNGFKSFCRKIRTLSAKQRGIEKAGRWNH